MAVQEVRLIHIPESGPQKDQTIVVLDTLINKVHCAVVPLGNLKIKFSNIFQGSVSYCFDQPFKVLNIEERPHGSSIYLEALPEEESEELGHV